MPEHHTSSAIQQKYKFTKGVPFIQTLAIPYTVNSNPNPHPPDHNSLKLKHQPFSTSDSALNSSHAETTESKVKKVFQSSHTSPFTHQKVHFSTLLTLQTKTQITFYCVIQIIPNLLCCDCVTFFYHMQQKTHRFDDRCKSY